MINQGLHSGLCIALNYGLDLPNENWCHRLAFKAATQARQPCSAGKTRNNRWFFYD